MTSKERRHRDDTKLAIETAVAVIAMWRQTPYYLIERAFDTLEQHADYLWLCCSHGIEHYRRRRRELCGY